MGLGVACSLGKVIEICASGLDREVEGSNEMSW